MDWQLAICIKVYDIVYATVYKIEKGIFLASSQFLYSLVRDKTDRKID